MAELLLGVNIDHIATLRNARGTAYPDPVQAAMTLAPSPPGWHAGQKWYFVKRKWLSSGLNQPAPEPVFLPPDVTVPSTAWSVLEHEGGIAATLSRRQSTSIPADVVWRSFSPLPLVCLLALPLHSA